MKSMFSQSRILGIYGRPVTIDYYSGTSALPGISAFSYYIRDSKQQINYIHIFSMSASLSK